MSWSWKYFTNFPLQPSSISPKSRIYLYHFMIHFKIFIYLMYYVYQSHLPSSSISFSSRASSRKSFPGFTGLKVPSQKPRLQKNKHVTTVTFIMVLIGQELQVVYIKEEFELMIKIFFGNIQFQTQKLD